MALTKASRSMLNTGISDSSDATALTFSSAEDATFAGHVSLSDSKKLKLGADGDLEIFHDGSYSYIKDTGTGDLRLQATTNLQIYNTALDKISANFHTAGPVTLYHDNSAKLATASDGIDVTGHIDAATITTTGAGTIGGNLTVTGNLQVDGTTTTINSTTYTVDDLNITLASGAGSSSAADGAGITIDGASATWNYTHSNTSWVANKNVRAPRFLTTSNSSSNFYSVLATRSGSGTSNPDIYGSSNTLVLGYSDSGKAVHFNSTGATFTGTIDTVGRIQVSGTTDQQLVLNSTDDGAVYMALSRTTGGRHGYMGFGGSSDTLFLANETSGGNTVIQTNGTTAISVDSSQGTTLSGHLIVNGNTTLGNADTDTVTIPGDLAVDTDTLFVDVSADRVGINDNSPDEVLTLKSDAGGIRIKGATTTTKGLSLRYDESAGESEIRSDQTGVNQINLKYRALNHIFGRNDALEYMRITDGGLVGIGRTPSTGNLLDVAGRGYFGSVGTGEGNTKANMETNAVLKLKPHDGNSTNMTFAQVNSGAGMGIQVSNGPQTANWDIALNPYGGNVGIGTTSPNDKLHIKIGTNLNWQFGYPSSSITTLAALNDAEDAYVEARIDALTLNLNSQSGGKVGIGTTSPAYTLEVKKSVNNDWISRIYNEGTTDASGLLVRSDTAASQATAVFGVYSDGAYRMMVRGDGKVGIGTSSPGSALVLSGPNNLGAQIRLINTAPTPDNDWTIGAYYSDQTLRIRSNDNATTVMTMKDTGQVNVNGGGSPGSFAVYGTMSGGDAAGDPDITKSYGTNITQVNGSCIEIQTSIASSNTSPTCTITWAKGAWAAFSYFFQYSGASYSGGRYGGGYHNNSGSSISGHNESGYGSDYLTISGSGQTLTFAFGFPSGYHPSIYCRFMGGGGMGGITADEFSIAWTT